MFLFDTDLGFVLITDWVVCVTEVFVVFGVRRVFFLDTEGVVFGIRMCFVFLV